MGTSGHFEDVRAALADRYRLISEIGQGGMATVYLAEDPRHGRQVAVKVLKPELAAALGPDRFLREIAIASKLTHPHIVPLYESGEAAHLLYYVMPYVKGESLRQRLAREKPLPIEEAIRITGEIADALSAAHAQGVIHRDIKPANILLQAGHAMVTDFGLARAVTTASDDSITSSGLALGTPGYMSPEQATGNRDLDERTDVYSLGCVLYEMLAGEAPYTGPSAQAVIAKQLSQPVPRLRIVRESVSATLEHAIGRALSKVPADRYSSVSEFAAALKAERPGLSPLRTAWVGVAGLTGAALLLMAAVFWITVLSRRPPGTASGGAGPPLDPKRVAVLYFDDQTAGKALGYVANGLTEDLIDELSQIRALRVISPNGVRPYQGKATPLDSLSRQLGVGTIVGGTVAMADGVLRVTVRLIDAHTGEQLQSRTLQQPWEDPFTLEGSITREVAQFLRERLGQEIRTREERAGTRSVPAWEMAQRAQELASQGRGLLRSGEAGAAARFLWRADSLFARAEALDPSWMVPVMRRGGLAVSLAFVSPGPGEFARPPGGKTPGQSGAGGVSLEWLRRGIELANAALSRSPHAPEALTVRGEARFQLWMLGGPVIGDSMLTLAESDLQEAVTRRPDLAHAWYLLGELYDQQGRFTDAANAAQRAFEEDPFLSQMRSVLSVLFFASLHSEHFDDARSWCQVGRERYPGDPRFAECELTLLGWTADGRAAAGTAWRMLGETERQDTLGTLSSTWAYRRMLVAAILARGRAQDSARAVIARTHAELKAHPRSSADPIVEAYVQLLLGEPDEALNLLRAHLARAPRSRAYVARHPWFVRLHDDPRFRSLVLLEPSPVSPAGPRLPR